MKLLYILLFICSLAKADKNPLFKDDVLHTQASINIVNFASSSTTYFQYELCKNVRLSVSLAVGLTAGIAATNFKEDIYDGYLGKGHKDNRDRINGIWGAGIGTLTFIPAYNKWFVKNKINLEI